MNVTSKIPFSPYFKVLIDRFPIIAQLLRFARDSRSLYREPRETPLGFKFIGNSDMEKGLFEKEEVEVFEKLVRRTEVFVNVGANIGYYCCLAIKNGVQTIAFEPIELNVRYLCKNILANKWAERIEIFPIALSDKPGVIEMFGEGTGASLVKGWGGISPNNVRPVPVSTVDLVIGRRLQGKKCLILVDTEGSEYKMLEGAEQLLFNNPKPIWFVEISIGEHQPKGIKINPHLMRTFQKFLDCGYQAWTANQQCRLVTFNEIKEICRTGNDTLLTHNFLFAAPNSDELVSLIRP